MTSLGKQTGHKREASERQTNAGKTPNRGEAHKGPEKTGGELGSVVICWPEWRTRQGFDGGVREGRGSQECFTLFVSKEISNYRN